MKEPTNNLDEIVPGRLTSAELRAMALRQQQQIDSQQQILTTKEQRLRFLKSQEIRNAVANSEGERLRRLRERVEAQESKLRRLRALRGQVDLQKTYNVTLSNDLDSIRALFSEKEKELSLAVAKVEALTRQLEDLRRDRRCPINMIVGSENGAAQPLPPQASRELEKLRRELMFRNQLSMQQDARLHLQREALQQRQAELRSVDQRIYELQTRLQRKKAANIQIVAQNQNHQLQHQPHLPQQQQQQQRQQQSEQQQLQKQQQHTYNIDTAFQTNLAKHGGVAALKQQLLQKQTSHITTPQQHINNKFSNIINREPNRNIQRGNVAAVEPYIHTPQKSTITNPPASNFSSVAGAHNILKHTAAATANTNQQNQLIQDLTHHVKLNLSHAAAAAAAAAANTHLNKDNPNYTSGESDESKLAKKILTATIAAKAVAAEIPKQQHQQSNITDNSKHIYAEIGPKKRDHAKEISTTDTGNLEGQQQQQQQQQQMSGSNFGSTVGSKIPKSIVSSTAASASPINNKPNQTPSTASNAEMTIKEKNTTESSTAVTSEMLSEKNIVQPQITVHSMPLGTANKSVATAVSAAATALSTTESLLAKPKLSTSACNIAVPPRKPFSSVAPTSVSSSIPKMITYSPKVNRVAPNVIATAASSTATLSTADAESNTDRPALPPKPSKLSPTEKSTTSEDSIAPAPPMTAAKKAYSSQAEIQTTTTLSGGSGSGGIQSHNINDNLPIKAKPLTIRKQPMSEQPRLKTITTGTGVNKQTTLQNIRKIDVSPAPQASVFLFADATSKRSVLKEPNERHSPEQQQIQQQQQQQQYSPSAQNSPPLHSSNNSSTVDEPDKIEYNKDVDLSPPDILKRRTPANSNSNANTCLTTATIVKPKLARRVSFDPLALLLDASLEGELELVKKTAMQVANASAANDEGITALHNAICAGHFDIVKFLVEFGCDVNAQDSDGWTPLHCAASCNNLSMVKFLVESGACLFAATLSDHETPAEKCEEDEEGFDGCSEYLYSIQEKLGILHSGEVYPVFAYDAQNNDELSFNVNDRLIILRKGDDAESEWWWAKNVNNEEGYVPRNLLGLYPRIPPQSANFND